MKLGGKLFTLGAIGYLLTLFTTFIYSGGIVIVCKAIHSECRNVIPFFKWLGILAPPLYNTKRWPLGDLFFRQKEATAMEPVEILLISFCLLSLPVFIHWGVGFLWPWGLFGDGCGAARADCGSKEDHVEKLKIRLRVVTLAKVPEFVISNCRENIEILEAYNQDNKLNLGRHRNGYKNYSATVEWAVDIVTEKCIHAENSLLDYWGKVHEIVVPVGYQTPNQSYAKARALHYANEPGVSTAGADEFLVHMDEETLLGGTDCVENIYRFCIDNPDKIGQGMILYGCKSSIENIWTTMADSIRVLDDYTTYRETYSVGYPLRGMKGSFVVIKNENEKKVSFDVGERCSMTEDCAFALMAMQKGFRMGFIPAIMYEQSPFSFLDFMKQRRRWLRGLLRVCAEPSIHFKSKCVLAWFVGTWSLSPFVFCSYMLIALIYRLPINLLTVTLQSFVGATACFGFTFAALLNFQSQACWKKVLLFVIIPFLLPVFAFMEAFSVLYALVTDPPPFEVIDKSTDKFINRQYCNEVWISVDSKSTCDSPESSSPTTPLLHHPSGDHG